MQITDILPSLEQADVARLQHNDVWEQATREGDAGVRELEILTGQLLERNIHVGKVLAIGGRSLFFAITGKDGAPIDSAILRIDMAHDPVRGDAGEILPDIDSAAVIKPVLKVSGGAFEAEILPRGKQGSYGPRQLAETLSVLASEGNLARISNLKVSRLQGEFMDLPGIGIPSIVDLNVVDRPGEPGNLDAFCQAQGISRNQIDHKLPNERLGELRAAQQRLDTSVRAELAEKGVTIEPVSTRIDSGVLTEVSASKGAQI